MSTEQSVWEAIQEREAAQTAEIRLILGSKPAEIAAAHDFGTATAAKRGRNPKWPYVPVVKFHDRTQQLRGLAYATREEAVARADRQIEAWREKLINDLCKPNHRALREQHGLPRNPLDGAA